MAAGFDARLFAAAVRSKRGDLGLREVATTTGVSAATLSRIEMARSRICRHFSP